MGFFMGQDIKPFRSERLYFDPIVSIGYFENTDAYVDGNPDFPGERAGSHDSDADNFITGEGGDSYYRLRFKYLLPIGSGRDRIQPAYQFNEGILTGGASGADGVESVDQRTNVPRAPALLSHAEHRERRPRREAKHQWRRVQRFLGQPRLSRQPVAWQRAFHEGCP